MIPRPQNKISIQTKPVREKSGTNRKRWSRRMSSKKKCDNPFSTVIQTEDFPAEKENQESRLLYSSRAQQTMSHRMKEIRSKMASRSNERFTQLKQQLKLSDNKSEQPQGPTEFVNGEQKYQKKTCEKLKKLLLKESHSQQIDAYYRTQPQNITKSVVSQLEDQNYQDQQLFYFGDISPRKKLIKALIDCHGSNDGSKDGISFHNRTTNLGKDLRAGSIGSISHGPEVISPFQRPQFVQNTLYRNSQSQTAILQSLPSNVSSSQVNKVTRIINQILQDPEQSSIVKSLGLNLEKVEELNQNKKRQVQTNRYAEQNLEDQHSIVNQSRFQQSPEPDSRLKLNNSITAEVNYGDTCAIVNQSPNIALDNSRIVHITAFDLQKESGKTVLMYPQFSLNFNKREEEEELSSVKQEQKRSMNIDKILRINSRFDTQLTKRDDTAQGNGSVMKRSTRYNVENFNRELEEDSILSSRCHYEEQKQQRQSENCSAKERQSHLDQAVVLTQNSSELTTGSEGQVESSFDSDQNQQMSQDIQIKQSMEKRVPGNDVNFKKGVMYGYNNLDLQETQMIDCQTKKYNKLLKKYYQIKKLYNELQIQHEQVQSSLQNSEAEKEDLWLKLQKFECRLKQAQLVLNDQNDEVDLQFNQRASAAVLTQVSDQQDVPYTPLLQQQKDDLILINQNTSFSNSIKDVLQKKKQIRFIEHEIKSARKSFNQQIPLIAPFQIQSLQSKVKESINNKLFGSKTMRSIPQSFSLANFDEKKHNNLQFNASKNPSLEDLMTPVPISQQRIVKPPPSVKKSVPKIDLSSLVTKDQPIFINTKDGQDFQNLATSSLVSVPTAISKSFSKLNLNKTSMTLGQLLRPSSQNLIINQSIQQTSQQNIKNIPSQTPKNTMAQTSVDIFSQDRNINPLENSSHDISANSGCKQFKLNNRNIDNINLMSGNNFGLGEQEDIFSLEFLSKNTPSTLLQKTQKILVQKSDFSQLASQVDMQGKNQTQSMHSFYQTTGNLKQVFRHANILEELKSQNKPSLEVVSEETKKRTRNTCKNLKLTVHKSPVKTDLESLLKPQRIMSQIKNAAIKTQTLFPKQMTPSKKLVNNPMGVIIAQQSMKKQAN